MVKVVVFAILLANTPKSEQNTPQAPNGAAAVQLSVRGRVVDSSGASIPGSSVTVAQNETVVKETVTNEAGDFNFDVPPGEYQISVSAADFKPFQQNIRVTQNLAPLSIALSINVLETRLDVVEAGISVDPNSTLTSQTISGDQLQDLPENEDDLAAYLQQLAGGAGAAGSQASFIIDGFSGGRLPPRDQIQQIIFDTNPFSAEGNGGLRIQIITRPGSGNWTGQIGGIFNDSTLNAATPAALNKPARQQRTLNLSSSGPVIPNIMTMSFTAQSSETDAEGNAIRAILPDGSFLNQGVVSPSTRRNFGIRGQTYLSSVHTLNFNLLYGINNAANQGIGGLNLADRASDRTGNNWQIQISERAIPNTNIVNEFRFQVNASYSNTTPVTNAIAVNVQGAFNSGGGQNRSENRNVSYQVGNTLRWSVNPAWNLQSGFELNHENRHSFSQSNFLGTYTFASLEDYVAGRAQSFTQTSGDPLLDARQTDLNAFLQVDWRVSAKASLGLGARYIWQTNLSDSNNIAPTLNTAYQLTPTTVVRAGARLSFQGFDLSSVENVLRNDGTTRQSAITILAPTYVAGEVPVEYASQAAIPNSGSTYVKAPNLDAPYAINSQFSLEQTLPKSWRLSNSFDVTRGVGQIRTRNINAPYPGTALPDDLLAALNSANPAVRASARAQVDQMRPYYPVTRNIYQYESAGKSFSKNWSIRLFAPPNLRLGPLGLGGAVSYTLGWSEDDGSGAVFGGAPGGALLGGAALPALPPGAGGGFGAGPIAAGIGGGGLGGAGNSAMNQYDWASEWARSGNDQRHRAQALINIRAPGNVNTNFNINAASGRPYTITAGQDRNGDGASNDRPEGISRNTQTGPSSYNVNMTFTKMFPLKREAGTAEPQFGGFPGAPGGLPRGGGPGGLQGAGAGGPFGGPGATATAGPQLVVNVQVSNLLNNTQARGVNGVQTSPLFNQVTSFAGGRNINLALSFRF